MRLTDEENEYLICLKRGLSSEQMVVELGMTVDEVIEFGDEFFHARLRENPTQH